MVHLMAMLARQRDICISVYASASNAFSMHSRFSHKSSTLLLSLCSPLKLFSLLMNRVFQSHVCHLLRVSSSQLGGAPDTAAKSCNHDQPDRWTITYTVQAQACVLIYQHCPLPFPLQGKEQNKPEVAPLHIQNPFETSLNVSKNVNATQLDRFVALCQESSWLLQQSETNKPSSRGNNPTPWGLATLLLPSQVAGIKSRKKRRPEPASERIKSLLESLKSNGQPKKS